MLSRLFSMFSNFHQLDFHIKTHVTLAHLQKPDRDQTSPNLVLAIKSACLQINLNWIHKSSRLCSLAIEYRVVVNS